MSGLRRLYNRDGARVGAVARLLGAEGYERSRIQPYIARVHDAMLDSLAGRVDSPCRILDVGCGTGRLLRRLCQRWPAAEMTGVDPNEGMVSVAKQRCPSASFYVAGAESIPIDSSSIDLAVSSISLHNWNDQLKGLQELTRALRPGGCVCLADITLPRTLARLVRSVAKSPTAVQTLIAQAGLELQEQHVILVRTIVLAVAMKPARHGRDTSLTL